MNPAVRTGWWVGSIGVTALLVLFWQYIALHGGINAVFLPSPVRAWHALIDGLNGGELADVTKATIGRMLIGWALASLLGIVVGSVIGSSRRARQYLGPTLELVRPVPVSAFMPIVMAFLGLNSRMVIVVIAIGSVWPVLLATVHGVSNVNERLLDVSRSLKLTRLQTLWKIALPNAQADILAGARVGLTVALVLDVLGEMLASEPGLGFYILTASTGFHSDQLFAGVILLGVIGLVSNLALQGAEWRVLRWTRR